MFAVTFATPTSSVTLAPISIMSKTLNVDPVGGVKSVTFGVSPSAACKVLNDVLLKTNTPPVKLTSTHSGSTQSTKLPSSSMSLRAFGSRKVILFNLI